MSPPPITPTIRYYPPGIRRVYWVISSADYNNPTRAELDAGTDVTNEVAAMSGWSVTSTAVETPDLGNRFTSQVPGALTSQTNDLTFYTSQNSADVRQLMPRDSNGFIVICWEGDVAGQLMDVFPVRIMSQAMDTTVTNAGQVVVSFAVTSVPANNVAIPA